MHTVYDRLARIWDLVVRGEVTYNTAMAYMNGLRRQHLREGFLAILRMDDRIADYYAYGPIAGQDD